MKRAFRQVKDFEFVIGSYPKVTSPHRVIKTVIFWGERGKNFFFFLLGRRKTFRGEKEIFF